MDEKMKNELYPNDGADFYVDEFGERIERPQDSDDLLDKDMMERDTEEDEQLTSSEPSKSDSRTFHETLADQNKPVHIIEED
jgi:hypothetical protein